MHIFTPIENASWMPVYPINISINEVRGESSGNEGGVRDTDNTSRDCQGYCHCFEGEKLLRCCSH